MEIRRKILWRNNFFRRSSSRGSRLFFANQNLSNLFIMGFNTTIALILGVAGLKFVTSDLGGKPLEIFQHVSNFAHIVWAGCLVANVAHFLCLDDDYDQHPKE